MKDQNNNVLQPTLSSIGLVLSFITAISPIFNNTSITKYFTNSDYVVPASLITVLLGILVAWNILENHKYVNIRLPSTNNQVKFLVEKHVIWLLSLLSFISFVIFFALPSVFNGLLQMVMYILFFNFLIASFSLLLSNNKAKLEYDYMKQTLPIQIVSTLEKNGLIDTEIKILDNNQLNAADLQSIGINEFFGRIVTLEKKDEEPITVILSGDGRELFRVIKPENKNSNAEKKLQ